MKTIIRWFFLTIGSVLIAVSLSSIIISGIYLTGQYMIAPHRTCITGKMLLQHEGNFVDMGEMEFCGEQLSVSGLYGPSLEYHILVLKGRNARLREALNECNSKILL